MSRIFISYRRADGSASAGRIYDHLVQSFGEGQVFMDVDAIEPGQDFVDSIHSAVGSCTALIAVIGPNWFGVQADGSRRLDEPEDFVRLEIAAALERGVRVIPVLVDGGSMPKSTELPEGLQALARRQKLSISHSSFRSDVQKLCQTLQKMEAPATAPAPSAVPLPVTSSLEVRLAPGTARIQQLDIPEAIYSGLYLSPEGTGLYLTRFRETVQYSHKYDLIYSHFDRHTLTPLADLGRDDSYYEAFVGPLFFKSTEVQELKAHRALCFREHVRIPQPTDELVFASFAAVAGMLLFQKEGQLYGWSAARGALMGLSFHRKVYSIAWSHPRLPLVLVTVKLDGPGKDYERPAEYHLLELDDSFRIKASRAVLVETPACRYEWFRSFTDDRLLFAERTDTNGDGLADYKDERSQTIRSLSLRSGEISTVVSGSYDLWALAGNSKGVVYFVDCLKKHQEYGLYAVDPRSRSLVTVMKLQGGSWREFAFDDDLRVAVCQQVLDTTGKGNFYNWENRSRIHRIDLV